MFTILKDQLLELPKNRHDILKRFLNYFEKEWMVKTTPDVFSVRAQVVRTTSSLQSFNAALARKLQKHGRFDQFLEVIRDEVYATSVILANALDGDLTAQSAK
ncbi:uncharacterized protein LOC121529784 [Drosophila eugracilis]|uniref:uncharacterized protein LOC121529784 n=1 Tax=Drosophila eugracilis TaxID=29029 RepID=UPI001BDA95CF|nr:uncharacterized protein LOC121529784 [Drosophila eugracilis]